MSVHTQTADQSRLRQAPAPTVEPVSTPGDLDAAIERATGALLQQQAPEGYWCYELEADCTIPAEYILMMHYMDEIDSDLEARLAVYLREHQQAEGGWPLYFNGAFNMSASVKAYYALKLAGDAANAPHMVKARELILAQGGAARANVFTRIALALFGQIPWRGVPFLPVEILLLPRWFPFHLSKVSYWSRTVMVPLLILCTLKRPARNPRDVHIRELFTVPPERERHYFPVRSRLNRMILTLERIGRRLEPLIPGAMRRRAMKAAEAWFVERLNGTGGLGAIFPAMVNAYEALAHLGYSADHPYRATAMEAIRRLLVVGPRSAYCQPCVSPIWDTGLACLALQEVDGGATGSGARRAMEWMVPLQLRDGPADWRDYRPDLPGGGWPFQFENGHYPDLDDTAVVAWTMDQVPDRPYEETVRRAAQWLCGMQSRNGGFAAFDADNTHYYLNEIPFADHGALLDPPTSDVTARCVTLLARLLPRGSEYRPVIERALEYLRREQEPSGAWFGRWGTNYIYGTWSVLVAFAAAGVGPADPTVRRAVRWLESVQRPDGGWGESNDSYSDAVTAGRGPVSTSYQTAWAMLGLMAAGEGPSASVRRGAEYLLRSQRTEGLWQEDWFTAPGFPRVFYLKYHGYSAYFPLWALARYRNVLQRYPGVTGP
ncbi:MAG: squalene--hopene cyclase [Chromatiales bacterium 21-64-14]|nr:MAG: squalene--hopene cyclase [Chromatiales bacterium 21-64-14]HQU16726.1 squalene--hopene cyclase [Gammaproteobacteria bacterium]